MERQLMGRYFAGLVRASLALLTVASVPMALAQSTDVSTGSFVFLSPGKGCENAASSNCIKSNASAATLAVTNLKQAGVAFYLLPSLDQTSPRVLENAISSKGGRFLTYEGWAFQAAIGPNGQFDCSSYTAARIVPFLLPLKNDYPDAFYGFNLEDEPGASEHQNLGRMRACLMSQPAFAGMKTFVNMAPVDANDAELNIYNSPDADVIAPSAYGVDCTTNTIFNRSLSTAMVNRYTTYVISVLDNIEPDIVAFDQYAFNVKFDTCTAARDLVMSENMSIVASQAIRRNIAPVAYLQNVRVSPLAPHISDKSDEYANFHHLRWFSGWFYVFGGRGFANFVSHDTDTKQGSTYTPQFEGLLNADNTPRDLLGDEQSTSGMNHQIQVALADYPYQRFVAPFLGVPTGSVIGWMPSGDLMAGEYGPRANGQAMVLIASRPLGTTAGSVTIGLNQWWPKIERLDFNSGQWVTVGTNTHAIIVDMGAFPCVLYRLSVQL
ncbi:MAG: hypothetical protein ACYC0F_08460 [Rhodanobacter sp.]